MRRQLKAIIVLTIVVFQSLLWFPLSASASGPTCGSTGWCSGSDGNTGTNTQGLGPQLYIGEVYQYQVPYTSYAFNTSGATAANSRAALATGIGTDFYVFSNGPGLAPGAVSGESQLARFYCFGWYQATQAEISITNHYFTWVNYASVMFFDMEINGTNTHGWLTAGSPTDVNAQDNRQVFNGFSDYAAARSSANPSYCNGSPPTIYQYGVYSSPRLWHILFDTSQAVGGGAYQGPGTNFCNEPGGTYGTLANTFIWTSEGQNTTKADPGTFTSGNSNTNACWFASSNYPVAQQFWIGGGTDYDLSIEPVFEPVLNHNWGN